MSEWTIAVITPTWDEPSDTLYANVGTVEADTEDEAVEIWGAGHTYDRDYCSVYARPKGESWYGGPEA